MVYSDVGRSSEGFPVHLVCAALRTKTGEASKLQQGRG